MKKFYFLIATAIIFLITGTLHAASLEVGDTDVVITGADGLKNPNGDYVTIPPGVIVMWSGSISAIPNGWALCDGTNGTPNLTDRFIVPADADSNGVNNVGDTGGSDVITEEHLPPHSHDVGTLKNSSSGSHTHAVPGVKWSGGSWKGGTTRYIGSYYYSSSQTKFNMNTTSTGAHTHTISGSTGTSGSGSRYMPKYYALAFIMRLHSNPQ